MAYKNEDLILLQTAGDRGSVFLYKTTDAEETVIARNYFKPALGIPAQLRTDDVIIALVSGAIALLRVTVEGENVTVVKA